MTLLLIRHGETPLNVARVLQPADTPLSPRGRAQARALAARLADGVSGVRLAGIVASDLKRAADTAAALAEACGLPLALDPLLRERDFGDLRGRRYDALDFDPLTRAEAPPNGESQATFVARCADAWDWLCAERRRAGGPLAVVTHGLVIRSWLVDGPLRPGQDHPLPDRLGNTSLTEADAAPPHRLRRVNCMTHLDGGVGEDGRSLSGG